MKIEQVDISKLKLSEYNPRRMTKKQVEDLKKSISKFGLVDPLIVNSYKGRENVIIGGHQRFKIAKELGYKTVPVVYVSLDEERERELNLRLNKNLGDWDLELLANFDEKLLEEVGFDSEELDRIFDLNIEEDDFDAKQEYEKIKEPKTKYGDIYQLGDHRLMCGDATKKEDAEKLMNGEKADMVFTDPPYGKGKGILNDQLKGGGWIDFYRSFTVNMVENLKKSGYFYVWGYFETLSRYWERVLKERKDCNFRNFIIWVKNYDHVAGRKNKYFRQFPENYEACLLCIYGQPFQDRFWLAFSNKEYYWEEFEPIRKYLDNERKKMGWSIKTVKKIVGHSDLRDHWFNKSQWSLPTEKVYQKLQEASGYRAFMKEYKELRKEYEELRGYFDNSNGWTDVWTFDHLSLYDDHPTVKPLEACHRGIITTSRDGEIVLDLFGGSGSTLIACEQLNRKCYMMELDPKYCDVIVERWEKFTNKKAKKL